MANAPYGQPPVPPPAPNERWSVNMPAVIGVVFVFLVGVIIWVITSTGGEDSVATDTVPSSSSSTTSTSEVTTTTTSSVPGTTTPAPMPVLTTAATTTPTVPPTVPATPAPTAPPPPTQPPTTAAPTTTTTPPPPTSSPDSEPDAVPGDLGIEEYPMQAPACDESYITIIASAVGDQATAAGIENVLEQFESSNYLRTDQTCPSLNQNVDGEPIYVVYFGPFPFAADACAARAEGTEGSYARQLSNDLPPNHTVACPPLDDD